MGFFLRLYWRNQLVPKPELGNELVERVHGAETRPLKEPVFAAMTAADFDDVEKLWSECEGVRLSPLDDRAGFERFLARNAGFSQTARIGGVLAAAVLCGHDGRIGYLHHAAVAPPFRRHGLGRSIVGRCLDSLKAAGVGAVYAFVVESNTVGHKFWKSLGWSRRDVDVMQVNLLG